jgi:4-amino-4-deoxy-L-arabinose transferase-like glycosyltransferase
VNRKKLTLLLIAILALVGSIAVLFATRWGIGTSPDSVAYIGAARNIMQGNGFSSPFTLNPITHFAPLYSFLLAGAGYAGIDPMIGAKWLNALLFGANIFLVGLITISFTYRSTWLALVAAFLAATSVPMVLVHLMAWTEAAFLFFSFLSLFLLAHYFESAQRWFLITASFFAGLAFLTRYAGAALVFAGGLNILLFSKPWRRKIGDLLIFGVVSTFPLAFWTIRNQFVAGTTTSREIFFHPISRNHMWEFLFTTSRWVFMPDVTPTAVRIGFWLILFAGIGMLIYMRKRQAVSISFPYIIKTIDIFLLVYGLFLVVSISLLDANTPLDDRILSPAYVAGLILLMYLLYELLQVIAKVPVLHNVLVLIIVVCAIGYGLKGINYLLDGYHHGIGFSSVAWQQSDIWGQVNQLPADTLLFSNSPEAIYVNTGRIASRIPSKMFKASQQLNENYTFNLDTMKQQLKIQNGYLIYFNPLRIEAPPLDPSVMEELSLLWQTDVGAIYGAK